MTQVSLQKPKAVVITCEHGGCLIPEELVPLLPKAKKKVLTTHEGWDIGALKIAQKLSQDLGAPLAFSEISRLVCDLNRTHYSQGPFFKNIKPWLVQLTYDQFLGRYYWPYRMQVEELIGHAVKSHGLVLHLSIHSFTPKFKGEIRNADLGILYDNDRSFETEWVHRLREAMESGQKSEGDTSNYRVKFNYPYLGTDDGFTTHLRRMYPPNVYLGVEIEFNQQELSRDEDLWRIYDFFFRALKLVL